MVSGCRILDRSNNTNKLSPQERAKGQYSESRVQIIQINLVLKNEMFSICKISTVQIIQINLVLKNQ